MKKQTKEILVIEHDPKALLLLQTILSNSGFHVHVANTVKEAIDLAHRYIPHVVLMELMLSKESGIDYLEQHRKSKALSTIPVVVVGDRKDKQEIYKAVSLGIEEYIPKPIEAGLVVQKLRKILKDSSFPTVKFSVAEAPSLALKANGSIILANEVGFVLEAPMKIAEGTQVQVAAPILRELACEKCVFQRSKTLPKLSLDGLYLNDIIMAGLDAIAIKRIKKVMEGWQ